MRYKTILFQILFVLIPLTSLQSQQLLVNGDFEADPVLGAGQTALLDGQGKWTSTDANLSPNYLGSISGIPGWEYSIPEASGTHTDVGLGKLNDSLMADPSNLQSAYSNRWNKLIHQTVQVSTGTGYSVDASIDIGTRATSGARAGTFYLVAGEAENNMDVFAADAIVLDSIVAANPGWSGPSDLIFDSFEYQTLSLGYTYQENDAALGMPVTVAFRIEDGSTGAAFWDNASLFVSLPLLGDINRDGVVNFSDITPFISALSSADYQVEADCNEDGVVSFLDISAFITFLSN